MNPRAHLTRVDKAYIALHTAAAAIFAITAVLFATDDRTGYTDSKNWLWTGIVAATAAIAFTALAHGVAEVVWPNSEEQIRELEALNDECQRQADAIEAMDEANTRLTNELDDVRADRDALLAERDELLADQLGEASVEPDSPYVRDAVTSFSRQAHDAFLKLGPPPGYVEHAAELDEDPDRIFVDELAPDPVTFDRHIHIAEAFVGRFPDVEPGEDAK